MINMSKEIADKFGKLIVEHVRDSMISYLDLAQQGKRGGIYGRKIHSKLLQMDDTSLEAFNEMVPFIVDCTISGFLQIFDLEDQWEIAYIENEKITLLHEILEGLQAEYSYSEGWPKQFSQTREDLITKEADEESDHTTPWD